MAIETVTPYNEMNPLASYIYECSCGERYRSIAYAKSCRKCRNYCVFGYCTHVVDLTTNEVVAGKEPTEEEYKEASAAAQERWEEERRQFEEMLQREEDEYVSMRLEEAKRSKEDEEDELYNIQDKMMGV